METGRFKFIKQLENKKIKLTLNALFVAALALLFSMSYILFYRQSIKFKGLYPSDLCYYLRVTTEELGDRFLSKVFYLLHAITGDNKGIIIYLALVVVGIVFAGIFMINEYLKADNIKSPSILVYAAGYLMLFTGSIYLPILHPYFYRRSWNDFVWHSPTQQTMILFAILAMAFFVRISKSYKEKILISDWLGLAVCTAISTWTKPSFMLVFGPAVVLVFLIELFEQEKSERLAVFKQLFIYGCALIPAGLVLLYFTFWYGGANEGSEICFGISHFLENNDQVIIKAICGLSFPIIVFAFNAERFKDLKSRTAWGMLLFGVIEWMLIYETGIHEKHGNFDWGKQFGCFYLFMVSFAIAIENLNDPEFLKGKEKLRILYWILLAGSLLAVVVCRVYYFRALLGGHNYMF